MPYGISENQPDCSGWATVKKTTSGYDTVACHKTKDDAIKQMVAISLAENLQPLGKVSRQSSKVESDSKGRSMSMDTNDRWASIAHAIKSRIDKRSGNRTVEIRTNATDFEIREDANGMTFEGYAAVFDSDSEPLPFTERVARGAFSKSLKARNDIKLLWNHDAGEVLGSTRAGTAQLVEDGFGLKVRATLPDTTRGRDTAYLIKRGDVSAMSFGFTVIQDSWEGNTRTLESVRLHEISIVPWPAYTATTDTISVRSQDTLDENLLAEALAKMESGEELDSAQGNLIKSVIDKLVKQDDEVVAESETNVVETIDEVAEAEANLLALKLKQLDLQSKRV